MTTLLHSVDIPAQRRRIRKQRRALSRHTLHQSAQQISFQVLRHPKVRSSKDIGIYLDAFGEVPTERLILSLLKQQKKVYLPVICPMNQSLHWQKISLQHLRNQRFNLHRLGMKQPLRGRGFNVAKLDVVLMPLVIFDTQGHRVGMGGGFYDRTLAHHPYRPYRIGLAYDFQKSDVMIEQQAWDEQLNAVCTPTQTWNFRG